jgi:DNA-binding XRE family transcriptional regulator
VPSTVLSLKISKVFGVGLEEIFELEKGIRSERQDLRIIGSNPQEGTAINQLSVVDRSSQSK